jgi:hypothetical protein
MLLYQILTARACLLQMVTAYLMATEGLSPEAALAAVREKRKVACPNSGFLKQLELFHRMGCKFDQESKAYRYFKMEAIASRWWNCSIVDTQSLPDIEVETEQQVIKQLLFDILQRTSAHPKVCSTTHMKFLSMRDDMRFSVYTQCLLLEACRMRTQPCVCFRGRCTGAASADACLPQRAMWCRRLRLAASQHALAGPIEAHNVSNALWHPTFVRLHSVTLLGVLSLSACKSN